MLGIVTLSSNKGAAQDIYFFTKYYNGRIVDGWIESDSIEWSYAGHILSGRVLSGVIYPYSDLRVIVKYSYRGNNVILSRQKYNCYFHPDFTNLYDWVYEVVEPMGRFKGENYKPFDIYSNSEIAKLFQKCVKYIPNKERGFAFENPSYIFKYSVHHWIQDINGVYVYNPEPTDVETVVWNVDSIKVSKEHNGDTVTFKFASGSGVLTWRKYGKIIQVDTGRFVMGRHDGQFKHQFFPSGKIEYSNWCCGIEID